MSESKSSKSGSGYGGKRKGAGRKPGAINRLTALQRAESELKEIKGAAAKKAVTAAAVLGAMDEMDAWLDLLTATSVQSIIVIGGEKGEREQQTVPDWRIRLEARKFLTEQRDGKAKQKLEHSGPDGGATEAHVFNIHFTKYRHGEPQAGEEGVELDGALLEAECSSCTSPESKTGVELMAKLA